MRVPEKDTICVHCGTDLEKRDTMNEVVKAAKVVLYHDERGQGIGYKEAMDAMRTALKKLEEGEGRDAL